MSCLLFMLFRFVFFFLFLRKACRAADVEALSDDLDTVLSLYEVVLSVFGDED